MDTAFKTIFETWKSLQPFLAVDKCVDCECLQAGLTEMVMALEALSAGPVRDKLLKVVRQALDLSKTHGCLGCEPCEPADILISFYRTRDAATAGGQCGCDPSCTNGSSPPPGTADRR